MAFVPKVHNRPTPMSSRRVNHELQRKHYERHLLALDSSKAAVNNKWGASDGKQASYPHLRDNLKRSQLQEERNAEIELENYLLLTKLGKILERSDDPTKGTREYGNGYRLDANQVPVLDHCMPSHTDMRGAAVEPSSLNISVRIKLQDKIAKENQVSNRTHLPSPPVSDYRNRSPTTCTALPP